MTCAILPPVGTGGTMGLMSSFHWLQWAFDVDAEASQQSHSQMVF